MPAVVANPRSRSAANTSHVDDGPLNFHRQLSGYSQAALVDLPDLAGRLGVGRLQAKVDTSRFGLPSFKPLGAFWAIYRALNERIGVEDGDRLSLPALTAELAQSAELTLVAATDGNHGRAVARMASLLGLSCRIHVPSDMVEARRRAIRDEGAALLVVDGPYDMAVAQAAASAGPSDLVVSDTAWTGYETIPGWVIDGYSTIFAELDLQVGLSSGDAFDLVLVPLGVGALGVAVSRHFRGHDDRANRAAIVGVEPLHADCFAQSLSAGRPVTVPGPHRSIMAGLNCGTPSPLAWPILERSLNAVVTIEDDFAIDAMRELAQGGIVSGETGASSLAGLIALSHPACAEARSDLGIGPSTRVLVLVTEGATDPVSYSRIVG